MCGTLSYELLSPLNVLFFGCHSGVFVFYFQCSWFITQVLLSLHLCLFVDVDVYSEFMLTELRQEFPAHTVPCFELSLMSDEGKFPTILFESLN